MSDALWSAIDSRAWSVAHARHLLNRAGFGAPRELSDRLAKMAPAEAVDYLVDFKRIDDPLPPPDFVIPQFSKAETQWLVDGMSKPAIERAGQAAREVQKESLGMLRAWWFDRMARTLRPLEEKMTLFWHSHFAVAASKVQESGHLYQLNAVMREHAAGNVKTLTTLVGQTPAMLQYLDNAQNTKDGPNENWAREMLELFTLGHGAYSEHDIKEAARAFTGWTCNHERFLFRERDHDMGEKTFLGRTGAFTGEDVIDIVFEQPACAEHFARKLWKFFAYDDPEPEIVAGLAATLRKNNYELAPMLKLLFLSQAFYSERAVGTQIKCPAQLLVSLCLDLRIDPLPVIQVNEAMQALGQELFYPPNVRGWPGGREWANANTLTLRYNLPVALVMAAIPNESDDKLRGMQNNMMSSASGGVGDTPDPTGSLGRLLAEFDGERRRRIEERLGVDRGHFRQWFGQWLTAWNSRPPWDSERVVGDVHAETAGGWVDTLTERYLAVSISTEQRKDLLWAIGAMGDPACAMPSGGPPRERVHSTLHLLFSLAEYQVC